MSPAPQSVSAQELRDRLLGLPSGRRHLIAIAGPPGAGKSTLAEALAAGLERAAPGRAAIFPMDGYHYDDAILIARGLRPRKGAPETFDVSGLYHMLGRLRRNDEAEIAVPVFDRDLEISRNAARTIPQSVEIILVEGNYLLLDRAGWRDLAPLFDLTVSVTVSVEELRRRLTRRWQDHDIGAAEIPAKVEANDLPNGIVVLTESIPSDLVVAG